MKKIKLTQNKVALVDDEDFEWLNMVKWYAHVSKGEYRALRGVGNLKIISMSRVIMGASQGELVDHKNHNTLDNRRLNLRLCTRRENSMNSKKPKTYNQKSCSSTYKGVRWNKKAKRWYAQINVRGRRCHLGSFMEETRAVMAYNKAAKKYFGEFALVNE